MAGRTAAVEEKLKESKKQTEKLIEKAAGDAKVDATRAVLGLETKIKSALQELRLAQAKMEAGLETGQAKTE